MINIASFINDLPDWILKEKKIPWEIINNLDSILSGLIESLDQNYTINNGVAIHKTAVIEQNVVLKEKIVISENCFVAANTYLRGPVFMGNSVKIGPGSEIKQSIILDSTSVAHFNYIGNSFLGKNINLEAGSICANHYNEKENKNISVLYKEKIIDTKLTKFGSLLIGDSSRIGANAVLSPGTILEKRSIVKRLELIEQLRNFEV